MSEQKNKCGTCVHFDEQYRYLNGIQRSAGYGWCALKSEYPAQSEANQGYSPPPGCKVAEGDLAKPVIVYADRVHLGCLNHTENA